MEARVPFLPSPHFNQRPEGVRINLIVLHAISLPPGTFDFSIVRDFFQGTLDTTVHRELSTLAGLRVSAHFLVHRDGSIYQFVRCRDRAWHAGMSCWQGVENCNDYSIGIEIMGDEQVPFTSAQYREVARLCRCLMQCYPDITKERIVGHQHVAPGRKWDPGRQWDWQRFKRSLCRVRRLDLVFRT